METEGRRNPALGIRLPHIRRDQLLPLLTIDDSCEHRVLLRKPAKILGLGGLPLLPPLDRHLQAQVPDQLRFLQGRPGVEGLLNVPLRPPPAAVTLLAPRLQIEQLGLTLCHHPWAPRPHGDTRTHTPRSCTPNRRPPWGSRGSRSSTGQRSSARSTGPVGCQQTLRRGSCLFLS